MERQIQEILHAPASEPPEHPYRRVLPVESQPWTPLIRSLHGFDQDIESTFSRLSLSQDGFNPHSQRPSFLRLPETLDDVASSASVHRPMACGERQQALVWAQSSKSKGGIGGPFSLYGPHQSVGVGQDAVGLLRTGPNIGAGDAPELMNRYQAADFTVDGGYGDYQCASLHDKKLFSRMVNSNFSEVAFAQQNNFTISRPSSLYLKQPLEQWGQQLTIENMRGRIVTLATDQLWSGVLNLKLEKGLSEEEIEMVLPEVIQFLAELLRNQFGNQFVQSLFVACNEDQRTSIIGALAESPFKLISVCLNPHGGRAMQKLLEKLVLRQISHVVSTISRCAVVLATDPNGQHVIQHCVRNFPREYNECLFKEIANNCFRIATNKSGCCVLQSCLENSDGEAREQLVTEIKINALHLAQDPYGNYVVQHLIGLKMQEVITDLIRRFQGYFASLSCNKYASNVVEKLLLESGENHSTAIIMELLESAHASMLLIDPYGNFVIQSALSVSQGLVRYALLHFIQVNAASMRSNLYGKKILAWFEKRKPHIV